MNSNIRGNNQGSLLALKNDSSRASFLTQHFPATLNVLLMTKSNAEVVQRSNTGLMAKTLVGELAS